MKILTYLSHDSKLSCLYALKRALFGQLFKPISQKTCFIIESIKKIDQEV